MRKRLATVGTVIIMLASILAIAPASPTTAQEPAATPAPASAPSFTIRAAGDQENNWFEITIDPGESASLTAVIRNAGENNVQLISFATIAENPANGGFSAGSPESQLTGAALWLDYPDATYDLAPGTEQLVEFTAFVPSDTAPGNYVAALVAQTAEPLPIPGSQVFNQIIRSAISVEITVPGEPTPAFELGEPAMSQNGEQWTLDVPLSNTGTSRLKPQGELIVTTLDGVPVSTTQVEMGPVYSGNTTSIRVNLPEQLPVDDYLVSVNLTDEPTGATASLTGAPVTLTEPEGTKIFTVEKASVTPNADPVQYADVAATIINNGQAIPTANVTLNVQRNGQDVESYPLAQNQALPQGSTDFRQRYIPVDGWQDGTYTFQLVIAAVNVGTETILATVDIEGEIIRQD